MIARRRRDWAVTLGVATLVTAANGSDGAYFSQSWGWVALAFLCALALVLILEWGTAPGRLRAAFALAMTGLGIWVAASAIWSVSPASSIREAERMLVYAGLALALAVVLRRRDADALARGAFLGVLAIASYALATRLFPDWLESFDDPTVRYRLAEPIGYWNSVGLLAAMGVLIGSGFAVRGKGIVQLFVGGAAMPILATTLYFTFSRGAWLALAAGLAVVVVLETRRLRLLWTAVALAPASIAAILVASRQEALTTEDAVRADAIAQGNRFAVVVGALALLSGVLAVGAARVVRRVRVPDGAHRAVDAGLAVLAVSGFIVAVILAGGPSEAFDGVRDRFDAPVTGETANLNDRLFTLSGNNRAESVGVAWDAARERPLLGHGGGSFEYVWYEERRSPLVIRDAHSLYAETLGELGAVGLVLLGIALLTPIVAVVRARRARLVPAVGGAYVAWALHSAVDWHWEIVGVTLVALLAGGVALLASERLRVRTLPETLRWPLLAASVALTAFAVISLVGNQALFAAKEAVARHDWEAAVEHGRRAESLLVWSFEPHVVLGDAAAGRGDRAGALDAYREAVEVDGRNWVVWLRFAQVARGTERRAAYDRVRELNPREPRLPGEPEDGSG